MYNTVCGPRALRSGLIRLDSGSRVGGLRVGSPVPTHTPSLIVSRGAYQDDNAIDNNVAPGSGVGLLTSVGNLSDPMVEVRVSAKNVTDKYIK